MIGLRLSRAGFLSGCGLPARENPERPSCGVVPAMASQTGGPIEVAVPAVVARLSVDERNEFVGIGVRVRPFRCWLTAIGARVARRVASRGLNPAARLPVTDAGPGLRPPLLGLYGTLTAFRHFPSMGCCYGTMILGRTDIRSADGIRTLSPRSSRNCFPGGRSREFAILREPVIVRKFAFLRAPVIAGVQVVSRARSVGNHTVADFRDHVVRLRQRILGRRARMCMTGLVVHVRKYVGCPMVHQNRAPYVARKPSSFEGAKPAPQPVRVRGAKVHGIRAGSAIQRCTETVQVGQHSIGRDHSDNSSSVNRRPPAQTT